MKYKVVDNKLLWFNGAKWLVKETCETEEQANELLALLNE